MKLISSSLIAVVFATTSHSHEVVDLDGVCDGQLTEVFVHENRAEDIAFVLSEGLKCVAKPSDTIVCQDSPGAIGAVAVSAPTVISGHTRRGPRHAETHGYNIVHANCEDQNAIQRAINYDEGLSRGRPFVSEVFALEIGRQDGPTLAFENQALLQCVCDEVMTRGTNP